MKTSWPIQLTRRERIVEITFGVFFLALFTYALLEWRALPPGEPRGAPLQMMAVTGAALLLSIAALSRPRSRLLFYAFVVASMTALAAAFLVIP